MMNKKIVLKAVLFFFSFLITVSLHAEYIKGYVKDAETGEPLIGAVVRLATTNRAVTTDLNGYYELDVTGAKNGVLELFYIYYKDYSSENIVFTGEDQTLDFDMIPDNAVLDEIVVVGRKNTELQGVLMNERKIAAKAVENIGASEMSIKGLSNVAEAMETLTGISFAEAGQLFVRGLGDRYSLTTLNGLPIASPNPDNKLIPLDIFPSSVIGSISVTKVYDASSFADYSGARIDIITKENVDRTFLDISLDLSGNTNTTFGKFYTNDRKGSMFRDNNIPSIIKEMDNSEFDEYIRRNDPFGSTFAIGNRTALPAISGTISGGTSFKIRENKLNLLASLGISNDYQTIKDGYIANLTAQGTTLNAFDYDSYNRMLNISGLFNATYMYGDGDKISYNMTYARNSNDEYKLRKGFDSEGVHLIGSNGVAHTYSLFNNQIAGHHHLGSSWELKWDGSYTMTKSNEPDRKQVMYRDNGDERPTLFKLNRQETMRYFGELGEDEYIANASALYKFGEKNRVRFGATYKNKSRDYSSVRFYYNLTDIDPVIDDIFNPDFLGHAALESGDITISRDLQPKNNYYAQQDVVAGFADVEYYPVEPLMLSLGVRYEYSKQTVEYWDDASIKRESELSSGDIFPALNIKYNIDGNHALRFAASMTVTRPSFIEMAPFLYKESYGSAEIRGNENIENGYNFNIDLKYEYFANNNRDMFSAGIYYKFLKDPIERIQQSSGGSVVYSFRNAEQGMAAGFEAEFKKSFAQDFYAGANVSLMYTDVKLLSNGGVYTDDRRALQGASPYLGNAFLTYAPRFKNGSSLSLSLLYNLQGPRIHTVGIYGLGNIDQEAFHTLDFNMIYEINKNWNLSLAVSNILDSEMRFVQDVKSISKKIETEHYRYGRGISIGVNYGF